jgi:protoheme IX farnesyltransferase
LINRQTIKLYYRLTKPGIIYGNAMTAVAGFLFASQLHIQPRLLVATLLGISFVMASACVYNNYLDRGIDQKMARTKKRALVTGDISARAALVYATVLGAIGFALLAVYTNALTVVLGLVAIFMYVVVYGITKRTTVHGTLVGSIPGALPPVAGYTAVTNSFDLGAWFIFAILVLWQMPHFYAIAMYRREDYAAANIPVLTVKRGMKVAKRQIMFYILALATVSIAMTLWGYTGITFAIVMALLCGIWLGRGWRTYRRLDDILWSRKMFFFSLTVLTVFSVVLSVDGLLP